MSQRQHADRLLVPAAVGGPVSRPIGASLRTPAEISFLAAIATLHDGQLATLLSGFGYVRAGLGVPTDAKFVAAGGVINASTNLTAFWTDMATGDLYYRNASSALWKLVTFGEESSPTFPLALGSSDYTHFDAQSTGSTPCPMVRVFEQASGTNNMPTYAASDLKVALDSAGGVREVVYSCKPTINTLASGAMDAQITTFLNAIPVDARRKYMIVHHEPAPDYDAATFRAAFSKWYQLIEATGRSDLIACATYLGNGDWETSGLNNAARNTPPDGWGGASTARPWDWLPDTSIVDPTKVALGFDVYSYYPSFTGGTNSGNDRSLRHLMRIILPLIRARGFYRWGIAENGIQMVQSPTPQTGGGTSNWDANNWTDADRLARFANATYGFRNSSVGAHPGYLDWLLAKQGPFPAVGVGTITNPYDTAQTAATQFQNPGQAYDAGANGCEFYTYFDSNVGSQGDYLISTGMADALLAAA